MKKNYFNKFEILLWAGSVTVVTLSFLIFDRESYINLSASLIGVTSLIFNAKGNPIGQVLMIIFSLIYGYISYSFAYYGEMITYIGMTMPMAVIALCAWLKNPYKGNKSQVKVNRLGKKDYIITCVLAIVVTVVFYFILEYFNTKSIVFATASVTTSFIAVYLTFRRSPYYAIGYAANDIVLIILWVIACKTDISYISVVACFMTFLVNDIYGFVNWKRMQKNQQADS